MKHAIVFLPHGFENRERLPAVDHEVFRNDLNEIDVDRPFQEVAIVLAAKAKAQAGEGWD